MTEQERLYDIYKGSGITKEYIQRAIDEYLKLGEPAETAFAFVRAALALAFSMPSEFKLNDYAVMVKNSPQNPGVLKQFDELREEMCVAARYKEHGVNVYLIDGMVQSGLKNGLTHRAALAGVRYSLGMEYGKHEYFTTEDIAEILKISPKEAENIIWGNRETLMQNGGIPNVMSSLYIQ